MLNWPHLWRTLVKAIRAVSVQREASPQWIKRQMHILSSWLWKGEFQPATALTAALSYLDHQRDWMGSYDHWKQQGYPVGSGLIERAVAVVINRRMKRQGMSWLRRNATSVVALRVALLNEEWPFPAATHSIPRVHSSLTLRFGWNRLNQGGTLLYKGSLYKSLLQYHQSINPL